MMKPIHRTPQEYRGRAIACERLADRTTSPEIRKTMLHLAMRWRALADEAEPRARSINSQSHPLHPPSE
jgi:hypothetical protein